MLDLRKLETLHRLSVCGTITATAESLGYSSSAISQQVAALEREVGQALVERTARSVVLTAAGEVLARHAATFLAASERAEADLAELGGLPTGRFVVSAIPNLAEVVAAALADVQENNPTVDIVMREIRGDEAVAAVADHLSDLAVIDDWSPRPAAPADGLTGHRILTEPVGLAVSTQEELSARTTPLTAADLRTAVADRTWLCAPQGYASRTAGDARLAKTSAVPRRRWEFEGLITIAALVATNTGCALLPRLVAETQPPGQVALLALVPPMRRHVIAITRSSAGRNPNVTISRNAIATRLADLANARP